jgi:trimeric autotransporter adhesin
MPAEETYWINKRRAAAAEKNKCTSGSTSASTERDAVEERDCSASDMTTSVGQRAQNAVYGVGVGAAVAASGAILTGTSANKSAAESAAASGLSSSSVQKISSLECQAIKTVEAMEGTANRAISDVYKKDGKETTVAKGGLSNSSDGKSAVEKAAIAGLGASAIKQISSIERNAVEGISNTRATAKAAIAGIYKKEGITMPSSISAARSMAAPATAAAVAAMAAGLGSSAVKQISAIEEKAQAKAGSIDEKALKEIATIYRSEGATMSKPSTESIVVGSTIVGATSTAANAGLSPSVVHKVAAVERKAADDIAILDAETAEDLEGVYNKNGLPMMKGAWKGFSASRGSLTTAAAAASVAGLGATSVKKISAIETSASAKMATMDAKASAEITAVARKVGSGKFTDTDIAAALDKISGIEKKVTEDMEAVDDKAIDDITAIYKRNGFAIDPAGWEGPAIPSAAVAAAAAAGEALSGGDFASDTPRSSDNDVSGPVTLSAGVTAAVATAVGASSMLAPTKSMRSVNGNVALDTSRASGNAVSRAASSVGKGSRNAATGFRDTLASMMGSNKSRTLTGVGAAASAAVAAGLSSSAVKNVASIEKKAADQVVDIDTRAVKAIAAVYKEEDETVASGPSYEIPLGTASVGAAGAAVVAGLRPAAVRKIAAIERKVNTTVDAIDENAAREMASVYKKDGMKMKSSAWKGFGVSRAATITAVGAAALSGLGPASIKKIDTIEMITREKNASTDKRAVGKVAAVYQQAGVQMKTDEGLFATNRPITMTATAAASAAGLKGNDLKKVADIEEGYTNEICFRDAIASTEIKQVYENDGVVDVETSGWKGFGAWRTATFGAMTTAPAAAYKALASKRARGNTERRYVSRGSDDSDEEGNILSDLLYGIHLAVYDVGATIASAGTTITGRDYEGPEEYEERYEGKRGTYRTPGCCA